VERGTEFPVGEVTFKKEPSSKQKNLLSSKESIGMDGYCEKRIHQVTQEEGELAIIKHWS